MHPSPEVSSSAAHPIKQAYRGREGQNAVEVLHFAVQAHYANLMRPGPLGAEMSLHQWIPQRGCSPREYKIQHSASILPRALSSGAPSGSAMRRGNPGGPNVTGRNFLSVPPCH